MTALARTAAVLSILLMAPPLMAQCPENAVTAGAYSSVAVFRQNGFAVGRGSVALGEPLIIQMALCSYPWDSWHSAPMACFGGGKLSVSCGGLLADLTPDDGVAMIGPVSCGAVPFVRSKAMAYTVTPADVQAGRLLLRGFYAGGTADLWSPMPIGASCLVLVTVRR